MDDYTEYECTIFQEINLLAELMLVAKESDKHVDRTVLDKVLQEN